MVDLTAKYELMCIKAREIQALRNGWSSDYLGEIWILPSGTRILTEQRIYVGKMCTWVPRADQLTELINFDYRDEKQLDELRLFIIGYKELNTMEKVWLAFVMHKKFKKYWDDHIEDWVVTQDETVNT